MLPPRGTRLHTPQQGERCYLLQALDYISRERDNIFSVIQEMTNSIFRLTIISTPAFIPPCNTPHTPPLPCRLSTGTSRPATYCSLLKGESNWVSVEGGGCRKVQGRRGVEKGCIRLLVAPLLDV